MMRQQDTPKNLPELTHLQFAVLDSLGAKPRTGRELRTALRDRGIHKSGPAFYQMMARLEEAKFVEGWYTQEVIDGQIIKERQYQITGSGVRALNATRRFYAIDAALATAQAAFS